MKMQSLRTAPAILAAVLLMAMPGRAQVAVDTTLVMSDGVRLDALYVLPTTPRPPEGYPAILLVHGFGGSKNNNRALAVNYARRGFAAAAYSVRGQGSSEGLFTFFAAPRILDDLRENIAFTKQLPGVNPARIAVQGGSQGGLHAWNAAAYDMGVRCVVSIIANGRAEENWLENDAMNWTFAAATTTTDVRFDPAVASLLKYARESGDYSALRPFLRDNATNARESSVTTPTAIFISYHDGFFNQNAALRQFEAIPAAKRIVLYPGGHSMPPSPDQNGYVLDVIDRWLAYWLKEDASAAPVASPDSAVIFFDGGTRAAQSYAADATSRWLLPSSPLPDGMSQLDLYFGAGGLGFQPPPARAEHLITYINILGSTPLSFRTAPLLSDVRILPPPGSARLLVRATGTPYQMNLLLYDRDPVSGTRIPICRGHRQASETNSDVTVEFTLTSVLHTVKAGHVIEALLNGGAALVPDQANNFGNVVIGPPVPSLDTFISGGSDPSRISLYVQTGSTSAEIPPVADDAVRLFPAWPNPSRDRTTFSYALQGAMDVRLSIHDMMGREVAVPVSGFMEKGRHAAILDSPLPAGVYVYRLSTSRAVLHGKLVVTP